MRSFPPLVLGVIMGLTACVPPDAVECETAGDCGVDSACHDGSCVPADAVAEGEGEGEGDADVLEQVCLKVASCGLGAPGDCIAQAQSQRNTFLSIGTPACLAAIQSQDDAYTCLLGGTCEELESGDIQFTCGGVLEEFNTAANQCQGGEGEGEGEGESDPQCLAAQAFPDNGALPLSIPVAEYDAAFDDQCPGAHAVGLVLEAEVDVLGEVFAVASFNGSETVKVLSLRAEDDFVLSGVACAPDLEQREIAVQLTTEFDVTDPGCAAITPP